MRRARSAYDVASLLNRISPGLDVSVTRYSGNARSPEIGQIFCLSAGFVSGTHFDPSHLAKDS